MKLTVCDVGPRDGLQNDPTALGAAVRAELCEKLAAAGMTAIEAASFVNEKRVPQMAGAGDVFDILNARPHPGVTYSALVLNERGYDRAVAAGVGEIHYAFPVTETFARRNQNATVDESIALAQRLTERARADGLAISINLSVAFGCPFEGAVDPGRVLDIAARVLEAKPAEICVADTIGVGVPRQVRDLVGRLSALAPRAGAHFHNTRNTGFANALAAVESGAQFLDASVGGVGGCPFAPKATGNIATEDLVYMLHGMGIETGIDLDALIGVAEWLREQLRHDIPSALCRAGNFALA